MTSQSGKQIIMIDILANISKCKSNQTMKFGQLTIFTWNKNLCFAGFSTKFIEIQGWLLLTFFICLHSQLSSFNSIIVQMSEKCVHQIDSKNDWLLLSVTFTAKRTWFLS